MKIRQATLEDKEKIIKLVRGLYSKNSPKMVEKWNKNYNKMFKSTIVVEINNKIVAYLAFGLKDNSLYVGDLYVLPIFRRRKIATKLINFVDEIKNNLNKKFILVDVRNKSVNAKRFYENMGFKIIDENKLKKDLIRLRK